MPRLTSKPANPPAEHGDALASGERATPNPNSLSFISDVQTAVAQIEQRMASAHASSSPHIGPATANASSMSSLTSALASADVSAHHPSASASASASASVSVSTVVTERVGQFDKSPPFAMPAVHDDDAATFAVPPPPPTFNLVESAVQPAQSDFERVYGVSAPLGEAEGEPVLSHHASSSIEDVFQRFEAAVSIFESTVTSDDPVPSSDIPAKPIAPVVEQFETLTSGAVPAAETVDVPTAPIGPTVEQFETQFQDEETTAEHFDISSVSIAATAEHFEAPVEAEVLPTASADTASVLSAPTVENLEAFDEEAGVRVAPVDVVLAPVAATVEQLESPFEAETSARFHTDVLSVPIAHAMERFEDAVDAETLATVTNSIPSARIALTVQQFDAPAETETAAPSSADNDIPAAPIASTIEQFEAPVDVESSATVSADVPSVLIAPLVQHFEGDVEEETVATGSTGTDTHVVPIEASVDEETETPRTVSIDADMAVAPIAPTMEQIEASLEVETAATISADSPSASIAPTVARFEAAAEAETSANVSTDVDVPSAANAPTIEQLEAHVGAEIQKAEPADTPFVPFATCGEQRDASIKAEVPVVMPVKKSSTYIAALVEELQAPVEPQEPAAEYVHLSAVPRELPVEEFENFIGTEGLASIFTAPIASIVGQFETVENADTYLGDCPTAMAILETLPVVEHMVPSSVLSENEQGRPTADHVTKQPSLSEEMDALAPSQSVGPAANQAPITDKKWNVHDDDAESEGKLLDQGVVETSAQPSADATESIHEQESGIALARLGHTAAEESGRAVADVMETEQSGEIQLMLSTLSSSSIAESEEQTVVSHEIAGAYGTQELPATVTNLGNIERDPVTVSTVSSIGAATTTKAAHEAPVVSSISDGNELVEPTCIPAEDSAYKIREPRAASVQARGNAPTPELRDRNLDISLPMENVMIPDVVLDREEIGTNLADDGAGADLNKTVDDAKAVERWVTSDVEIREIFADLGMPDDKITGHPQQADPLTDPDTRSPAEDMTVTVPWPQSEAGTTRFSESVALEEQGALDMPATELTKEALTVVADPSEIPATKLSMEVPTAVPGLSDMPAAEVSKEIPTAVASPSDTLAVVLSEEIATPVADPSDVAPGDQSMEAPTVVKEPELSSESAEEGLAHDGVVSIGATAEFDRAASPSTPVKPTGDQSKLFGSPVTPSIEAPTGPVSQSSVGGDTEEESSVSSKTRLSRRLSQGARTFTGSLSLRAAGKAQRPALSMARRGSMTPDGVAEIKNRTKLLSVEELSSASPQSAARVGRPPRTFTTGDMRKALSPSRRSSSVTVPSTRLPRVAELTGNEGREKAVARSRLPQGPTFSGALPLPRSLTTTSPVTRRGQSNGSDNDSATSSPVGGSPKGGFMQRASSFSDTRRSTMAGSASANTPSSGTSSSARAPFGINAGRRVAEVTDSPGAKKVERRATMSLSEPSGLRPPKGSGFGRLPVSPPRTARRKPTVPQPFRLASTEMHEKSVQQIEEARKRADESESRRLPFRPTPMPGFYRASLKPNTK